MRPEFKEHIRNIIGKLVEQSDTERDNKVCFFKHYSSFNIDEEDIINIMTSLNLECDMFYYQFEEKKIQGPFCPFLDFIKELYQKYYKYMDCKEFVKKASVYPVIQDMLISYIMNGYCERNEDIIPREVPFEREKIIESVINIFQYITNEHKIVIVLDRLQRAHESTIELLYGMMKNKELFDIVIIASYNEAEDLYSYTKDSWNLLSRYIKDMEMSVDYNDDNKDAMADDVFIPVNTQIDVYLKNIKDLFLCLQLEQAKYYLDIIYKAIENGNLEVEDAQKIDILAIYSFVTVYNGEEKMAYLYCKKMSDIEYLRHDKERLIEYYYIAALVNLQSGQKNLAISSIEEGMKLTSDTNNNKYIVRYEMLKILIDIDKLPEILLWNPKSGISEHLIEMARDNNQLLHLAYAYIFGFNISNKLKLAGDKLANTELEECFKGIELAKELENTQIQIRAWQKTAVQASSEGKLDETIFCYNQCLKIMEGHNSKHEEAQIYNGIGYICLINEKYKLAYDYFIKAINIGLTVDTPKYILDAVYNLGITSIIVGDYASAVKNVNLTMKMMESLNLSRLNVCNKTKLYGLAIFAYIKLNQVYNAMLYYDIMKTALKHILDVDNPDYNMWEDDMYLYYTVTAMLADKEGDYDKANEYYEKVQNFWYSIHVKQNYILPKVAEEEAIFYKKTGNEEARKKVLTDTIKFCKKNLLIHNAEILQAILDNKNDVKEPDDNYEISNELIEEIDKMIIRCSMRKEIEKKNKMLSFFENWVDSLNYEFEKADDMINSSMLMIKNRFDIDSVMYISIRNGIPAVKYSDNEISVKKYQLRYICDYFSKNGRRIVLSRFKRSYQYHEELVSAFNRNDVATMIAIPFINREKLTEVFVAFRFKKMNYTKGLFMFEESDADLLRTAIKELIEALSKVSIKKELEKRSVTDTLTGLYNRQGMKEYINKVTRGFVSETERHKFTILYMDLDNFKYCNDHFGHEAGDAVLVAFSRMLEGIVESSGYIIRYGGDEFVIIIPDKDTEYGVEIAEKIFANLRHNKGFKKVIEELKNMEVNISEKNRITCSIGISSGNVSGYSGIAMILKRADEALYYVKNNTKNDYKVWNLKSQEEK